MQGKEVDQDGKYDGTKQYQVPRAAYEACLVENKRLQLVPPVGSSTGRWFRGGIFELRRK